MTETEKTEAVSETEEATLPETAEAAAYPELTDGIYTMESLEHWAKFHGRYYFIGDGSMTADWSLSGFTMNVESAGGPFTIYLKAAYDVYLSIWVDGAEAARPFVPADSKETTLELAAGIHEISVYKETEISPTTMGFFIRGISFEGTILEPPEDRFFIEVIGDSLACGDGSLGTYVAGEVWKKEDHSATHSFAFYLAEALDADVSLVAKGGIGLLGTSGGLTMPELYPYVTGFRDRVVEYDFKKVPDLIIFEMGGNDYTNPETDYYNVLSTFIPEIRARYGYDVPIVWLNRVEKHYESMMLYMRTVKAEDPNLYALRCDYGGSGSAALATQKAGHPNAAEQKGIAEKLLKFLEEKGLAK